MRTRFFKEDYNAHSTRSQTIFNDCSVNRLSNGDSKAGEYDPKRGSGRVVETRSDPAALFAQGHVLLEDVPGIGKTLVAKGWQNLCTRLLNVCNARPIFCRATSPAARSTTNAKGDLNLCRGPFLPTLFWWMRSIAPPPRTQSSLLESMAEGQVTADGFTHKLAPPFFVIATQKSNRDGWHVPLARSAVGSIHRAIKFGLPSNEDEVMILSAKNITIHWMDSKRRLNSTILFNCKPPRAPLTLPARLKEYIVQLVNATRAHPDVVMGVSPRGGVALQKCAQAVAMIRQRSFVTPDDIKLAAPAVMAHRLLSRDRRPRNGEGNCEAGVGGNKIPLE